MQPLTARQKDILGFITDFFADSGHTPTIREIAGHFAISIGPVQKHIKALLKKGYLRHTPGISRGIDLSFRRPLVAVPVLGRVPAGMPREAIEHAEEHIYLDRGIAPDRNHFALKIKGDSMTGSGIMENDVVVVRRQPFADDNDIVVAMVDGEATVKKLRKERGKIYLEASNPDYKPLYAKEIKILGKVVYLARKV